MPQRLNILLALCCAATLQATAQHNTATPRKADNAQEERKADTSQKRKADDAPEKRKAADTPQAIMGDTLREVVVTARELRGVTTTSRIDRAAMEHLQPTSFADLLELLPGNISKDPDMSSAATITLRETGTMGANGTRTTDSDYNISSLGTLFVVDGAPIGNDANMQGVPSGASTDAAGPDATRNVTNRGVDMRTISTDNIESVEIVRGIPSVEYGNLTSGMVNIRRIRRATPLTARFKADEYSKLFSVGKGFEVWRDGVVNLDLSWLDSKADPRDPLENYKRLTASARLQRRWSMPGAIVTWNQGFDYTGSFDNAKTDPDLSYNKIDEYRSSYNRTALTGDVSVGPRNLPWLSSISLNASVSYQADRLERRRQVAPQRASVAPTTMHEGVSDGRYLLSEYIADYVCDGRPLDIFLKLKATGNISHGTIKHRYMAGAEWTLAKNYGGGQQYDLERPLSASWTTRPRAYRDIHALQVLSTYAEENITLRLARAEVELQAGARTISMPSLGSRYDMAGRIYIDPRVNAVLRLSPTGVSDPHAPHILVGAGYGMTTKMPTADYLYPQQHYDDIMQLNYYDINRPTELSRVNLRTYMNDAANYALRPARNRKWELRLGADMAGNSLSVTYFRERLTDGFRYSAIYAPRDYRSYDASAIVSSTLTAPPSLDNLPYTDSRTLRGYNRVTNGSSIDKQGVELQMSTARWRAIGTALTLTGAWLRTTYSNSQMLLSPVSDVVDNVVVSNRYVGLYDTNDGRRNEQLSSSLMFDTQVPRYGLIFTTTLQCVWYVETTRLMQNGTPVQYIAADDGLLHPYSAEAVAAQPLLAYLVKTYNDDTYRPQRTPIAAYVNLKATKTIGRHLRMAVFVNRIIDHLPDYTSNGLVVRRSSSPYFGMELNVKI